MHFRERPWDLFLSEGYVIAVSTVLLLSGQGVVAAILLVLLVPGYLLMAALYPADKDIRWIERMALSFVLSLAVVPVIALLLNFTPFGIRLTPLVLGVLAFSVGMGFVAYRRRTRLPVEHRLSASVALRWPAWRGSSALEKTLAVSLGLSLILAGTILAYVLSTPRPGDQFTEFYILGVSGTAEDYPTDLGVSEAGTVLITVANHEFTWVDYTVRVDLVGVAMIWNERGGFNETVETNRTSLSWFNLTLDHDGAWTRPFTFQIDAPGLWQVRLLLFRDGDFVTAYRNLHLFVTVASA